MCRFTIRSSITVPAIVGASIVFAWAASNAAAQDVPANWASYDSLATASADSQAAQAPTKQQPVARPPTPSTRSRSIVDVALPPVDPRLTGRTRQALGFFGGMQARATLARMPRRTPIQPTSGRSLIPGSKPFQTAANRPTISPYLNLDRGGEDAENIPNYYAFVRPQLQQQEANRRQQQELDQLQRQMQGSPGTVVGLHYGAARAAGRSTPARFMDTAQFYSNWQR